MNIEQFFSNLENAVEQTARDLEPTMQEAALTAKALLARRVQNTGFGKKYRSRSYLRLRASKGYEVRFVNLTFTGAMFRGWKHPGIIRDGLKISGTVGGINQETVSKLKWNKSRYPNFDKINQEEKKIIIDNLIRRRTAEAFKKNLFRS